MLEKKNIFHLCTYYLPEDDDFEFVETSILERKCGDKLKWMQEHTPSYKLERTFVDAAHSFALEARLFVSFFNEEEALLFKLTWGDDANQIGRV